MNYSDQIFAQSLILAGNLEEKQSQLLRLLCTCAEKNLASRLRRGVTPADCAGDFVAAASLYALAAFSEAETLENPQSFQVGDLTVRKSGSSAAANCLRRQAELAMSPYLADSFAFLRA